VETPQPEVSPSRSKDAPAGAAEDDAAETD
jgi:hypothetical protein